MQRDGKYIYCIIASDYDVNLGAIGVGGRGDLVSTIGFEGLCMVVSDHPLSKFVVNPENMLAHQKVTEVVMKEFRSVLPIRFGTIAADAPTAIIEIGIAASKTCPIFKPEYAAAAEKITAIKSPIPSDHTVTSGNFPSAGMTGL